MPGGSRRRFAIARLEILLTAAFGIRARLKVDLDQADAGQRARLNVVDTAAEGEEPFVAVGDVRFNLLRRHARVKGCNDDDRDVDLGETGPPAYALRLATPTTMTIRQNIRMKKGYLIAKEDITRSPPALRWG